MTLKCEQCANYSHYAENCADALVVNSDECKKQFYALEALAADFGEEYMDYPEPAPEEQKKRYFLIKWLIQWILKDLSEESTAWFNGVCFKPAGEKQPEGNFNSPWLNFCFRSVWVDQYRNGGYTGDDFAGNLYYKIFPFVYLCFGYEC